MRFVGDAGMTLFDSASSCSDGSTSSAASQRRLVVEEHDDELRRRRQLPPVRLLAELLDVLAHLPGVIRQPAAPRLRRTRPPRAHGDTRRATPSSRSRSTCRPAASRSRRAAARAPPRPARSAAPRSRSTASIPAISITRRSWISPQRPRVCDSPRARWRGCRSAGAGPRATGGRSPAPCGSRRTPAAAAARAG